MRGTLKERERERIFLSFVLLYPLSTSSLSHSWWRREGKVTGGGGWIVPCSKSSFQKSSFSLAKVQVLLCWFPFHSLESESGNSGELHAVRLLFFVLKIDANSLSTLPSTFPVALIHWPEAGFGLDYSVTIPSSLRHSFPGSGFALWIKAAREREKEARTFYDFPFPSFTHHSLLHDTFSFHLFLNNYQWISKQPSSHLR